MDNPKPNHVFLSYSEENRDFVESLARRLQGDARLSFWFGPWHSIPGKPIQEQMEEALWKAQCCAVFIGRGGIQDWQNEQMRAAIQARVEDEPEYRIIPVLLPEADRPRSRDLPYFLRRHKSVKFRSLDDDRAFKSLLSGILDIQPIEVEGFLEANTGEMPPVDQAAAEAAGEAVVRSRSGGSYSDPDDPPIGAVRGLLLAAFTPETLRRFCQDRRQFREILTRFGPGYGLDDMVDEVITFCGTELFWDELLAEVKREKPRQYERFEPELRR